MENNLPEFLLEMLEKQYGIETTKKIIDGYSKNRLTTFRINTIKSNNEEIEKVLNRENIEYEKSNISNEAYILKNVDESKIQELEIYKEGKIYLQSLSSMLPPIILHPEQNNDILDMAAAPGGKTTQMAAITDNKAHITACEMNTIRAERLKYNIEKQGASSVYCMVKDARNIDDFFSFDQILLDAPCSGSGTLNINDDKLKKYFTEKLIQKSVKAQTALLRKAIKILKPGHEMVYSTCSILQEENENVVNEILKNGNIEIVQIENEFVKDLPLLPTKIDGTLCIMPNELFEGFFVAKLKKK
ncbi:MAG: RsmB/NOP family class I SAM-dependent RNA methyltransferase [Clostridia bacterium]|nr:RsmB/NOP family class I SAM-dependent RNA methyltransferase [Clostridia bacterium]